MIFVLLLFELVLSVCHSKEYYATKVPTGPCFGKGTYNNVTDKCNCFSGETVYSYGKNCTQYTGLTLFKEYNGFCYYGNVVRVFDDINVEYIVVCIPFDECYYGNQADIYDDVCYNNVHIHKKYIGGTCGTQVSNLTYIDRDFRCFNNHIVKNIGDGKKKCVCPKGYKDYGYDKNCVLSNLDEDIDKRPSNNINRIIITIVSILFSLISITAGYLKLKQQLIVHNATHSHKITMKEYICGC